MFHKSNRVGFVTALAVFSWLMAPAMAGPRPQPVSSLRSLDLDLELPDFMLEIHGFYGVDPVVVTTSVVSPESRPDADDAQGPLLKAFMLAETEAGATGCRWISGWADVTAKGIFQGGAEGTLAGVSSFGEGSPSDRLADSSLPRWYLALRPD